MGPQEKVKVDEELKLLRDKWSKEKKEGDPEIEFKIVFGMHLSRHDLDFLKKDFESCDIFIPESAGNPESTENALNGVASGRYTAEDFINAIKIAMPH